MFDEIHELKLPLVDDLFGLSGEFPTNHLIVVIF